MRGAIYIADAIEHSGSFSGSFQGDGSQLTGISAGTNLTQSIFVTQNGDDATGEIGNMSKPFATLESASQAATIGSTIFVYPGTYTVEANYNLAKPGLDYYFYPNTTVSKSTAGDMFDISGFTDTGFNVFGYADFILGSSAGSLFNSVNIAGPAFDYTFQARDILSDSSTNLVDYITPDNHTANWEFRNISCSNSTGFNQVDVSTDGILNITCDSMITKNSCISTGNGYKGAHIRAKKLESTSTFALHWYNGDRLTLIVDEAIGDGTSTSGTDNGAYRFTSGGDVDIVGEASGIHFGKLQGGSIVNGFTGTVNHQGKCGHLMCESGGGNNLATYNGTHVTKATLKSPMRYFIGFISTPGTTYGSPINQTDGHMEVDFSGYQVYAQSINVSGGRFIGKGRLINTYALGIWTISGGDFTWEGIYDAFSGAPTNYGTSYAINLTGGICRIKGTINLFQENQINNQPSRIINYTGGKLILDGGILTTVNSTSGNPRPAIYPDQDRDVHIFSGGINYNQTGSNALLAASGSGYSLTNVLGGMIIEDSSVE
jgi:hypothetical protein